MEELRMAEVKPKKKVVKKEVATPVSTVEKSYPIRGNIFEGKVTSAKANKTVTVEREITHFIGKYERYKKVKSKIHAHNPESINAKEGDKVVVGETRKISKTKNFDVMKILGDKK
jgi:small subunit ribosomal protein S17